MYIHSEAFEPWKPLGALISAGSLNSGLNNISIRFTWFPQLNRADEDCLASVLELVVGNAEVLDPLLGNSFKYLTALSFEIDCRWPHGLKEQLNDLRTRFSQPSTEGALRKKLPNISKKVRLNLSVSHHML